MLERVTVEISDKGRVGEISESLGMFLPSQYPVTLAAATPGHPRTLLGEGRGVLGHPETPRT